MGPAPPQVLPPFTDVVHSIVVPLETTAHLETIDATAFDLMCRDLFMPVMLAYRLADTSDAVYLQALKRIKEGLSKVLIPFFPFAGRSVATSPGSLERRLLCNDEGVPFIEAYMDADLDSVVRASTAFQPVPELNGHTLLGLDSTQYRQQMPDGAPGMFVQVTRFKCGGLVLGATFNHTIVDGQGFCNFLRAWSDFSRSNETAVRVDHDRAQLEVPSIRALMLGLLADAESSTPEKLEPYSLRCFEVAASTIEALKAEAKTNAEGPGWISTADCITAQLFRSFQARPSVLGEEPITVTRIVEGRERFVDRPVSDVCGNFISGILQPDIPRGEVLEMPLASIASRFGEKLETAKTEDWLVPEFFTTVVASVFNGFSVNSWCKFGLYEMDFGFGKPYFAVGQHTYASHGGLGTAIIFPPIPSSRSSAATVNILSTPELLQALEKDPQFQRFFVAQENALYGNGLLHHHTE